MREEKRRMRRKTGDERSVEERKTGRPVEEIMWEIVMLCPDPDPS